MRGPSRWLAAFLAVVVLCGRVTPSRAERPTEAVPTSKVRLPLADAGAPVVISAAMGQRLPSPHDELWWLRGRVVMRQGNHTAQAREAVVWIDRSPSEGQPRVTGYLEGDVLVQFEGAHHGAHITDRDYVVHLYSSSGIDVAVDRTGDSQGQLPAILDRARQKRREDAFSTMAPLRTVAQDVPASAPPPALSPPIPAPEFTDPGAPRAAEEIPEPIPTPAPSAGMRRIRFFSRSDVPLQAEWIVDPVTNRGIGIIDAGVNIIIDDVPDWEGMPVGTVDLSADRVVIWTVNVLERIENDESLQPADLDLEIYMEGNIVFRQGDRIIHADRMYYDVKNRVGVILDAELRMTVPDQKGYVRLRAEILRQLNSEQYFAEKAYLTTSQLGVPGYRIQSDRVLLHDRKRPKRHWLTGEVLTDSRTNEIIYDHDRIAVGLNNYLFIRQVPVFYWPVMAADLEEPDLWIRRFDVRHNNTFGFQVLTDWDPYQVFGIEERPPETKWNASLDYLQKRGFGHGTTFSYEAKELLNIPGPTVGLLDFWGISDHGKDDLGRGRIGLEPEADYRYRLFGKHRQRLPENYQFTAELGLISDRNYLEQYERNEWTQFKDQTTGLELKQTEDNISWAISADARVNDFWTESDKLPRLDHFWLGQELLDDRLTWFSHTHVGYARFHTGTAPQDPKEQQLFERLPWELTPAGDPLSSEGIVASTRQEVDFPVHLGPMKVVPYALGELSYWGENRRQTDQERAYGQVGIRASLPFWKADPTIHSQLLNVHGLAHKVTLDAEASWSDATSSLSDLTLYNDLDDNSLIAARQRYAETTFAQNSTFFNQGLYDERFYALRDGMGGWVTSPSTEIADDLLLCRLGMRHRWQTKRGMPGRRHIIDWIELDTNLYFFPKSDRDNFGELVGPLTYDARWHLGDQLTLFSDGWFQFIGDQQRVITIGGQIFRRERGSLLLGLHTFSGIYESSILRSSARYQISEKWNAQLATSIDLNDGDNVTQSAGITRLGESFFVRAGFHFNTRTDNVGVSLTVQPRFWPSLGVVSPVGGSPSVF